MSTKLYVKPLPGQVVRRPASEGGQLLPKGGDWVPNNTYWQRRLLEGSVEESELVQPVKPSKPKSKPSSKPAVTEE